MVTAETAVALPSLMLVLGIALAALTAASTHIACVDAARLGARALARGDSDRAARAVAADAAPDNAGIALSETDGFVRVAVRASVRLGPAGALPLRVSDTATTRVEP
ncbi:hypothetical protein FHX37_4065 [Haloactinospora alba]|uniref:TadE-like protein n=1 Tax=Haloactinospora alba TaxID=405555 RepID=A0A543NA60_9ACTN|nr:TadE family type IV pilus minor pilin [Haloactinospora alba]TQN28705.1 hypothetical protein FHX37_4065 [Haloactinospora alba]